MTLTKLMLGGLLSTPKVKASADLLSGRTALCSRRGTLLRVSCSRRYKNKKLLSNSFIRPSISFMASLPLCLCHLLKATQVSTVTLTINFQCMIWAVGHIWAAAMTWLEANIPFLLLIFASVLNNFCKSMPQTPLHTLNASHCSGEGSGTYSSACIRVVCNKAVDIRKSGRDVNRKLGVAHGKLLLGIALP